MVKDYRASIQRLRDRIDESDSINTADADALRAYTRELDALGQAELGDATHEKYLMRLVKMAEEVGGLAQALEDERAAKEVNAWINDHYTNPESNKTARDSLRSFGKHATGGTDLPESIEWVPTGYPSNFDRKPDPAKMYRWEEHVHPMFNACRNLRDKALIAMAYDIGPRSGELQSLTVGDLSNHEWGGIQVTVNGKQGRRSPVLMLAPNRVEKWLEVHPAGDDPSAPLWSKLNSGEQISSKMVLKIFRQAAERADITPPSKPTPTRFRKSSASHLARRGVSQTALENRYGWKRGSDEAARYIAVFGDESEREIAVALGVDVGDDELEDVGPIDCPNCPRTTPRDRDKCVWCHYPLTHEAAEQARATQQAGFESIADLLNEDDVDEAEAVETITGLVDRRVQAALDEDGHD